ncbi:MAG: glycosyltransferase family 4 protein [Burkholderia sp.]|nr:glycosyltransferase family 4 protein [Burkholderia sp.]
MRIAQIAPLYEAVPPKLYGGTERVVSYLTEALVDEGHDVTLFASGDSVTSAKLDACWPRALRLDPTIRDALAPHILMMEKVRRVAHEFDVLHFHLDYMPFPLFSTMDTPFVTTLHGRLDLPELQPVFDAFPGAPVISISDSQRVPLPQAAIKIAAQSGLPLKIAAKVDKADQDYFKREIEPLLSQAHVEFVGEINEAQKPEFLSGAKALLFPIDWSEPFGLVMIESMACGTPVIAFNRGSVPEVIDHGVTGYIVEDVQGAVAALQRLDELSRTEIRAQFERRFSSKTMARNYVDAYSALIEAARRPVLRQVAVG